MSAARKGYTPLALTPVRSKADRMARGYSEEKLRLASEGAVLQPPATLRPKVRRRLSLESIPAGQSAVSDRYSHKLQSIPADSPPPLEQSTQMAAAEAETQPPPDMTLYDDDEESVTEVKATPPRPLHLAIPASPDIESVQMREGAQSVDGDSAGDDAVMIVDTPQRKPRSAEEDVKGRSETLVKNLKSFMQFHGLKRWESLQFSPNGRYVIDTESDRKIPTRVYDLKGPNVYELKRMGDKEKIWGFGSDSTVLLSRQYTGKDKFVSEDVMLIDFATDKLVFQHEIQIADKTAIERIRCSDKGVMAIQYLKTVHKNNSQRTTYACDTVNTVTGKAHTGFFLNRREILGFRGIMLVSFSINGLIMSFILDDAKQGGFMSADCDFTADTIMGYADFITDTHDFLYLNKTGQVMSMPTDAGISFILGGGLPYTKGSLKKIGTRAVALGQGDIEPFVLELTDADPDHVLLHTPQFVQSLSVSLSPPLPENLQPLIPQTLLPPPPPPTQPIPETIEISSSVETDMEEDSLPAASVFAGGHMITVPRASDMTSSRIESDLAIVVRNTPDALEWMLLQAAPVTTQATLELARLIHKSRLWQITLFKTVQPILLHPQFIVEIGKANRMFGVVLNESDPAPFYPLLANINAARRLGWVEFIKPREVSASTNTIHYGRSPILVLKDVKSIELDRIHIFDSTQALYVTMHEDSFGLPMTLLDRFKLLKPKLKWFYLRAKGEARWTTGEWRSEYEETPPPDSDQMYEELTDKCQSFWTLEAMPKVVVRAEVEVKQPPLPMPLPERKAVVLYPQMMPYVPTLYDANIRVGPSKLPIKGMGLFAARDLDMKRPIIIPYIGELLDAKAVAQRYPNGYAKYLLQLSSDRYVDASDPSKSSLARYANKLTAQNKRDGFAYNSELTSKANVRQTKFISSGEEIYTPYSSAYRLNGDDGSATAVPVAAASSAHSGSQESFDLAQHPEKYGRNGSAYDNKWTPEQITNRRLEAVKEVSDAQGTFSLDNPLDLMMCSLDSWYSLGLCSLATNIEVGYEPGLKSAYELQANYEEERVRIAISREAMLGDRTVFVFGVNTLTRYERLAVILLTAMVFVEAEFSKRTKPEYARFGVVQLELDGLAAVGAAYRLKTDDAQYYSVRVVREGVYGWDGKEFKLHPYENIRTVGPVDAKYADAIHVRLTELFRKYPVGSVVTLRGELVKIASYSDVFAVLKRGDGEAARQIAVWALK